MSGPVINEASKEVASSTSSAWITDAFDCYQVPLDMDQDTIDPLAEHIRYKCQVRHLGPAYLKCGYFSAIQVHFYEVTRSEISELAKVKRHSLCFSSGVGRHDAHLDTHDNNGGGETLCKNVEALPHFVETTQPLSPGSNSSTAGGVLSSLALPPKKRKKRTVIQRCVVFSVTKDHHDQQDLSCLSPDCTYYLFPPNSLMDVVNDMAPFQIFCTIHLTKLPSMLQSTWTFYKKDRIKLEDLAATCNSGDRLVSIGPHDQAPKHLVDSHSSAFENQSINVEISGASSDVCYPLLESVSEYQTTCQKLADLLQHHNQRATTYKAKFSLNPDRFLPYEQQSISSTTQYPHEKTNITTINIKSQDQRRTSLVSDVEQQRLLEDSATTEKWQHNKKKLPTNGPDNKNEGTGNDHIPLPTKKKKIKRNQSNRGKPSSTCIRKCIYCNATSTPMWRRGPEGAGTLCNACGVKWKHGKILSGNETSLQADGSSNTDVKELNTAAKKRKKPKTWVKKEKKVKTTTATSELDMLTNATSTIVEDLIMEDQTDVSSINLQLYETTYGHCESTTANDIHHHQSSTLNHDNHDRSKSSSSITPKLSASLTGMTMVKDDSHIHTSTFSTLSSQQGTILSSESIYNSPLASFTSTPSSSPPMSVDSQQHRGFLALSFAGKLDLEGNDDKLPLVAGADDVEAAAVLTLLRQS